MAHSRIGMPLLYDLPKLRHTAKPMQVEAIIDRYEARAGEEVR
ncbi:MULTISPECIES: hypothetical protein [unclassified Endozoicomonas]|nr:MULTISPECIES: hypothetical protein [unclassified Endozoicomonas]